jgi:molecular chaperone GrpE
VSAQDERPSGRNAGSDDIKVVDRRWWAQESGVAVDADLPATKPTYVEELERRLAEKDSELGTRNRPARGAAADCAQARARLRKEIAKDVERDRRTWLVQLLDVLDNLDRAVEAARQSASNEALVQGVEMVRRQFLSKLESLEVKRFDPTGVRFDPALHEAVSIVPVADTSEDGLVVGVVAPGYTIGPDVLRPARVAVGQRPGDVGR